MSASNARGRDGTQHQAPWRSSPPPQKKDGWGGTDRMRSTAGAASSALQPTCRATGGAALLPRTLDDWDSSIPEGGAVMRTAAPPHSHLRGHIGGP